MWIDAAAAGKTDRADKIYLEALSLFPRVLALVDLSLPIVIFSSTGQREITERLKHYGNIISEFEKPRLFGYQSHDLLSDARRTFWSAIEKALLLCRGRALCADILRTAKDAEAKLRKAPNLKWARHFELYLDESGTASRAFDPDADVTAQTNGRKQNRFVIAGLLVPYENALEQGARALHEKMEQAGLRWWPVRETDPYLLKRTSFRVGTDLPNGKQRPSKEILEEFLKLLDPNVPAAVCLEYIEDIPSEEIDNVRIQWRGDNRYRHMLADLLELILFDFFPTLDLDPESTLSIFVGTRRREKEEFKHREESVKRHRELFGFKGDDKYAWYRTIEESSILSILFEVLARRHPVLVGIKIEHARGVTLFYPEYEKRQDGSRYLGRRFPKWMPTRHQHYLADLIANECFRFGEKAKSLEPLFANGMYDKKDRTLGTFMLAARFIARGHIAEALLAIKDLRIRNPLPSTSCEAIIFQNIARVVKDNLTGSDFLKLVAGLHEEKQLKPARAPLEEGKIIAFDENTYTGVICGKDGAALPFKLQSWASATFPTLGQGVKFKRSASQSGNPAAVNVQSVI